MPKQTIEAVQNHKVFSELTPKQQKFLIHYLEGGDREKAAAAYYDTTQPDVIGQRLLTNNKIRTLVYFYHDEPVDRIPLTREELIGLVASRIRNVENQGKDFVALVSLYEKLALKPNKGRRKDSEDEDDESDVDDLVKKIEQGKKVKE